MKVAGWARSTLATFPHTASLSESFPNLLQGETLFVLVLDTFCSRQALNSTSFPNMLDGGASSLTDWVISQQS